MQISLFFLLDLKRNALLSPFLTYQLKFMKIFAKLVCWFFSRLVQQILHWYLLYANILCWSTYCCHFFRSSPCAPRRRISLYCCVHSKFTHSSSAICKLWWQISCWIWKWQGRIACVVCFVFCPPTHSTHAPHWSTCKWSSIYLFILFKYERNFVDKLLIDLGRLQVAMLDLTFYATLFQTDYLSSTSSQVISIAMEVIPQVNTMISCPQHPRVEDLKESSELLMFILTKNGHVIVLDSISGNTLNSLSKHTKKESAAISMYVIGK